MLSVSDFSPGQKVLIVSHSDADGHIIAEQSRRNLVKTGVHPIVYIDATVTRGFRVWDQLDLLPNPTGFDQVVFTDLMLSPTEPDASIRRLNRFARSLPSVRVVVIDHHPLAVDTHGLVDNLDIRFTRSVRSCCIGRPSEIMRIAAICDNDQRNLRKPPTAREALIARGLRRVLFDRSRFAGSRTLALLAGGMWRMFEQIGLEEAQRHRQFMGRRTQTAEPSPLLNQALTMADELLGSAALKVFEGVNHSSRRNMTYSGFSDSKQLVEAPLTADEFASQTDQPAADEAPAPQAAVDTFDAAVLLLGLQAGQTASAQDLLGCVREIDETGYFTDIAAVRNAAQGSDLVTPTARGCQLKPLYA